MRESDNYLSRHGFMIRATKQRVLALFFAFVFCFVGQVAELHYASAHGGRTDHTISRSSSPCISPDSLRNSPDNCALCAFDATLLRPAALPERLLTLPIAFAISSPDIAAALVAVTRDFPLNPSSPRAPPFFSI